MDKLIELPDGEECMALSGPFTLMEMRIAARLLREKRTKGVLQSFISPAKHQHEDLSCNTPGSSQSQSKASTFSQFASPVIKPSETHQEPQADKDDDLVDEGPAVIADEVALEVLEETEQVMVQEFSLEEAHFSGCNLSGLNLSFIETGNDDPLETEQQPSPPKQQTPQDRPMEEPSDLFTLACISDLAEKLEVVEIKEVTPATPSQTKKNSLSHLYSPISPADLSSQYLDAVDESLITEKKSQLVPDEVIDAIVSLNSTNKHPGMSTSEESSEFASAVMQSEESSKREESSFLQEASICNNENIADMSASSLVSSASSTQKENLSLLNDTLDEMDMILSMGIGYMETQEEDKKSPPASKDIEVQNHALLSTDAETYFTPQTDQFIFQPYPPSSMKSTSPSVAADGAKKVHVATPMPEKVMEYEPRTWSSGKKLFPTPPAMKTPGNAKLGLESKTTSVGVNKAGSAPQFKVPTSGGYKPPASRLPKAVGSLARAPITSPVSQYIRGPVVAPRIAVVHAKNTFPSSKQNAKYTASKLVSPKHYFKTNSENNSPNVPAIKLPYVDYDTASSIKVVEHMETKQKPLPNKIKKLMPSPGAVYRHTGRVNIPDQVDGRQEVSILVSHDAIHD